MDVKEKIIYLSSRDPFDGSNFKWIHVKTSKDQGWVFGEFISGSFIKKYSFNYIEDAGVRIENKGILLSGMHEDEILKILGQPLSRDYDETYNDDSLAFNTDEDLILLVHRYNKRLHHIIIKSPKYILTNDIIIGMKISKIDNFQTANDGDYSYSYDLQNKLKSSFYDTAVIIRTNEKGIIQEIQIGLPQP